jgi:3-oxoacyl-[acyl-carrier-protein] synthase II
MHPSRELVITGVGIVSPIGIGREAFWQALCNGQSGVGPITIFDAAAMPVSFGAELKGFDPKQYVKPRKALKVMCRETQTAFSAATLAIEDAVLDPAQTDPERIGAVFGSQMMYGEVRDFVDLYRHCMIEGVFHFDKLGEQFPSQMFPLWMLKNLPNMAACHVAIALDARGPNNTILLGEVSSLLALNEACHVLDRDAADVMIVGATGTRICLTALMYRGDINLSHRGDHPEAASRPFDADRDGMVNGEGAAAMVVERREHAERRGAPVLASIRGSGVSMNAGGDAEGQAAAIRRSVQWALKSSEIQPHELSHVNAHGLSTVKADALEATAIRQTLGDVPVTALKSYFGNLGPAGGMVELIGSVLALQHDQVPPTLNFTTPDPLCPVNVVHGQPLTDQPSCVLKLSQSGTGQAAAVVLRRA